MILEQKFDAVAVAVGHQYTPFIPDIDGIAAWNKQYPGTISHSKTYKTPMAYVGYVSKQSRPSSSVR